MSTDPTSLLRLIDANTKGDERAELFRAVSCRVRTGLLTADESALIAEWFDQIAGVVEKPAKQGEAPDKKLRAVAKVLLGETRGRPRGGTNAKYLKGADVKLPDHVDLCWNLRRWIAQTGDADRIFKLCAEHFGRTPEYIRELYERIAPTLGSDPNLK